MRVIVAAVNDDCSAHLALSAEGICHEVIMCNGEFGYSEHFKAWWRTGHGFILIEHDIAPWVGAVRQLAECPSDWCSFRYSKSGHTIHALGCVKFSTRLVKTIPNLPDRWDQCTWQTLENQVLPAIAEALRRDEPSRMPVCKHSPPVAHVRRLDN